MPHCRSLSNISCLQVLGQLRTIHLGRFSIAMNASVKHLHSLAPTTP
jgi:hypothetical protein